MKRKKFSADFKAKVALELIKNELTLAEISQKYEVHPSQIKSWKNLLISEAEKIFTLKKENKDTYKEGYMEALERKTGQLSIEIDFLKKNFSQYHKKSGRE